MAIDNQMNELLELRNQYLLDKKEIKEQKEELKQKRNEYIKKYIELHASQMDETPNGERLQRFLEVQDLTDLEFLYRCFIYTKSNNVKGDLTFIDLLFMDKDIKELSYSYGVKDISDYYHIKCMYSMYNESHPFLEDERIMEAVRKSTKLAYIDELFKDAQNILDYQGSYVGYQYVKRWLRSVLKDDAPESDEELILKDFAKKKQYVLDHYAEIARYLYEARESVEGSRLAICNHGLSRNIKKEKGSYITFDHNIFSDAIAFGTTLEKLQDGNYEDSKELLYLPHQRIIK